MSIQIDRSNTLFIRHILVSKGGQIAIGCQRNLCPFT